MSVNLFLLLVYLSQVQSANILGVFMFPSISHQIIYQPIWRELSLRGHKMTVVTPNPLNDSTLTNLTEISVHAAYDVLSKNNLQETISKDMSVFEAIRNLFRLLGAFAEVELNTRQFQELIHDRTKQFDLVLIDCYHPVMYALTGTFKTPSIGVSPAGLFTAGYEVVGNPVHPVLHPEIFFSFANKELFLWEKVQTALFRLWSGCFYQNVVLPRINDMAKKYFGDDIPHVGDLEKNVSMVLPNGNTLIYGPRANVPAIAGLGQMHIKPVNPLPQDLQKILDDSNQGVIYFSLGSNVKSVNLEENLRKNIIEALSELPYTVLWKWESDHLPEKPSNVITRKWLPQQDVLAHPNIRAFITQGGLQSTEEAISRGVPVIGMPFMGDQPMNVQKIVDLGIGLKVDPSTLTKNELKKSIIEVAENIIYKKKIEEARDILYDKPMTGLEKAVWWSEYVIRHKGARHLRSPTADISWFHYLLLDVIITVVLIAVSAVLLIRKMVQLLLNRNRRDKIKSH